MSLVHFDEAKINLIQSSFAISWCIKFLVYRLSQSCLVCERWVKFIPSHVPFICKSNSKINITISCFAEIKDKNKLVPLFYLSYCIT